MSEVSWKEGDRAPGRGWGSPCMKGESREKDKASWKPSEGGFRSKGVPAAL